MISPNLILLGTQLALKLIDGRLVYFRPATSAEFYNYWIRDAVITVEHLRYTKECPEHPDHRDCLVKCDCDYKTEWTRFFPLMHVLEMVKEAV